MGVFKGECHLLAVVEVVFLCAYNLIILMSLTRNEDYVARLGEHRRSAYGLATLGDA